jgi:hypothetical protein
MQCRKEERQCRKEGRDVEVSIVHRYPYQPRSSNNTTTVPWGASKPLLPEGRKDGRTEGRKDGKNIKEGYQGRILWKEEKKKKGREKEKKKGRNK